MNAITREKLYYPRSCSFHKYSSLITMAVLLTGSISNTGLFEQVIAASAVSIVAAGDWGCTENTRDTVANIKNLSPNLVLALGDYSYSNTPTCSLNIVKPIKPITRINIGNHDDQSVILLRAYLNHFGLSKKYYSYNIQNVHILTMSTELPFAVGSKQYSFVLNDLKSAATSRSIKWIIVNLHIPLYTSPNTCNESTCAGHKILRETYHPLFDKFGVDIVLEGHVHNYQRSYPIACNPKNFSSPIVTSPSESNYNNPEGQIYVIVGTGGVNLQGLSGKTSYMANQQDSKFGALAMRFSENKLNANFLSNNGSILDQFNITKRTSHSNIITNCPLIR
jgi:Icc-related predicted phosphoesterase